MTFQAVMFTTSLILIQGAVKQKLTKTKKSRDSENRRRCTRCSSHRALRYCCNRPKMRPCTCLWSAYAISGPKIKTLCSNHPSHCPVTRKLLSYEVTV